MSDPQNSPSESAKNFPPGDAPSDPLSFSSGRYRIERTLGSGGMAHVLLAIDSVLDRKVAIKVPHRGSSEKSEILEKRFLREAQAAAGLSHPNICPIYDVGESEGTCYIAMGYIEGCLLSQVIQETDQFEEAEVAQVIRKVASGAAEAHRHGVLHRDLKSSNIMIDRRGEPIILDFGLARFFSNPEMDQTLTQDGQALGTPAYMSPEQAAGTRDLTPASDIFSLGVIMWEMLCGERPFRGDTLMMMGQIVHGVAPSPRQKRPDISREMEMICLKALAKDPEDRFESMEQFQHALEDVLEGRELSLDLTKFTSDRRSQETADLRKTPLPDSQADDDTQVERTAISNMIRHPLFWVWSAVGLLFAVVLLIAVENWFRPPPGREYAGRPRPEGGGPGGRPLIPSPTPDMSAEEVFTAYDRDRNDWLDPSEFPLHIIHRADENGDDGLDRQELENGLAAEGPDLYRGPGGPRGERDRRPRIPPPGPDQSAEEVFAEYDLDGDELLDTREFALHIIHRADQNGDERLDLQELEDALRAEGPDLYRPPERRGGPPGGRRPPPDGRRPPEVRRPGGGPGGPGPRGDRPPRPL